MIHTIFFLIILFSPVRQHFSFQIWVFNCRGRENRFFKKNGFSSVINNLIDLYLHLKVICKFECPVRDTIESTEASLNTLHCFITILTLFCYFNLLDWL